MQQSDLAELKRLAEAATPGEWKAGHYSSVVGLPVTAQPDPTKNTIILAGVRGDRPEAEANAAFIAAADPTVVIALIASAEEAKRLRAALRRIADDSHRDLISRDIARAALCTNGGEAWPPVEGGWQSIETAPKGPDTGDPLESGPDILVTGPHARKGRYIEVSHWYRTSWTISWMDDHGAPDAWQPLPAPPEPTT